VERTGTRRVQNPNGTYHYETYTYYVQEPYTVKVEYEVEVEYEYDILKITLTNNTMNTVVRNMGLNTDQMQRYELLLETYGNKEYLFEGDIYSVVEPGDYVGYEVPPEAPD
jgi:hypothetical protein